MLLLLTGSSCAGKTTLAFPAAERLTGLAVHDFDEVGVPDGADRRWRQRTTEAWVRRALTCQERGTDLLLTGQTPLGELLASPSAPRLDGIAVLLVDVADEVRRERLAARDGGRWDARTVDAFVGWAAWHRGHAADPRHRPDVIVDPSAPGLAWHRWAAWTAGDPRWRTPLLDTTDRPPASCVDEVAAWAASARAALRAGTLPLSGAWADGPADEV